MELWLYILLVLLKFDVFYNVIVNFINRMNWIYDLSELYYVCVDLCNN